MVEKTETPQILDEISKANAKADARPRNQKKARRRFTIVSTLFLSLLGGVSYVGWQQTYVQQVLDNLREENRELGLLVESQKTQIFGIQEDISRLAISESADQLIQVELETLRQQVDDLSSQRLTERFEPNSDWRLDEAVFLLRMANQKLQLQEDIITTISLIESADIALLDSGNNNVFPIRQALAESLVELRDAELIDREGIFIRLGNLRKQAEAIKLMSEHKGTFSNQVGLTATLNEVEDETKSILDQVLDFFSSAFVVRDWDNKSEFVLAGGQPELIRQNLYLMLEQARFALVAKDKVLYQQSLVNTKKWFETYGSPDSNPGSSFEEEITSLMSIDIDPLLPNLNTPLYLIDLLKPTAEPVSR